MRELNHKLSLMENEYDQQVAKYTALCDKLLETAKVAEECEKWVKYKLSLRCYNNVLFVRQRRVLDQKCIADEEKLLELEQIFRETSEVALESERRYDEVKIQQILSYQIHCFAFFGCDCRSPESLLLQKLNWRETLQRQKHQNGLS